MIVVDANVLLLVMTRPADQVNLWMHEEAKRLFDMAARDEVELYAPTAVIAEVIFVLMSQSNYGLDAELASRLLNPFLQIEAFRIENKLQVIRACELWIELPRLGFVDALVAALGERPGDVLATFDKDFDRLPHLPRFAWKGRETVDQ